MYVPVKCCLFFLPSNEHTAQDIPQVDNRTCRERNVTTLPPISISRQHLACVTRPSALYCCGYSRCVDRSLRSVSHHQSIPVCCCVCDRSTLNADGNVKIVWIKYQYLNCINISDVLWFFPETHPRKTDVSQHAQNTNSTTPLSSTSSSGPHNERVAGPRCTAVASFSIGGCDPSSVINASLFCCAVRVCAVCRASRAPRKIRIWIFGNMVKWSRCPVLD